MSSSRRHVLAALAGAGLLSACGFRPLYYDASGQTDVPDAFRSIDILPVNDITDDRTNGLQIRRGPAGQQLRNALLDLLQPQGRVAEPVYTLQIRLQESRSSLGVRRNAFATRANLHLQAIVDLYDRRREASVLNSNVRVVSSYNILDSEYGTLIAEKDAREKAIRSLSEEIRLRLGSFLNDETS